MSIFKSSSSNPLFRESMLDSSAGNSQAAMTSSGAITKSIIMGVILVGVASVAYLLPNALFMWVGAIGGLITVIVSAFKKEWSPVLGPIYAIFEGLFVGVVTYYYASLYDGLVFNAISLTLAVFFLMLFLYKSRIIQVTETFKAVIISATLAIGVVYLISIVLSLFGTEIPLIHGSGWFGIGFSLVVTAVAAFNLILNFDFIEKAEQSRLPKYMEWYSAIGIWVTLIWLYIEMLRLLSKIYSRD
ncbi:MAG: Bax inhibitor-1/YccA family protein [Saprospiraceae bacterium]|nr:Bax inhibitor-1/YccA family protein [Saprospiraceae bacterium]